MFPWKWGWELVPEDSSTMFGRGAQILKAQQQADPAKEYLTSVAIGTGGTAAAILAPAALTAIPAAIPVVAATAAPIVTAATAAAAPVVAPVAAIGGTMGLKKILLAGGAGFLLASLLGGGGKQELKQDAKMDTTVTPTQDTTQEQEAAITTEQTGEVDTTLTQDLTAGAEATGTTTHAGQYTFSDVGGDLLFAPYTSTTHEALAASTSDIFSGLQNITPLLQGQAAAPTQITITTPSIAQSQEATQSGTNWLLIAAIGIGAYFLLGRKKNV